LQTEHPGEVRLGISGSALLLATYLLNSSRRLPLLFTAGLPLGYNWRRLWRKNTGKITHMDSLKPKLRAKRSEVRSNAVAQGVKSCDLCIPRADQLAIALSCHKLSESLELLTETKHQGRAGSPPKRSGVLNRACCRGRYSTMTCCEIGRNLYCRPVCAVVEITLH
jgi:hypothetical protein